MRKQCVRIPSPLSLRTPGYEANSKGSLRLVIGVGAKIALRGRDTATYMLVHAHMIH